MNLNTTAITLAACAAVTIGALAYGSHHKQQAHEADVARIAAEARLKLCNEAVAQLDAEAKEREAAAAKALAAAQSKADKYQLRADRLLRAPAAVPGDDCASAKVRARAWLEGRR